MVCIWYLPSSGFISCKEIPSQAVWTFVCMCNPIFPGLKKKVSQLKRRNTSLFNRVWDLVAKGDINRLSRFVKGRKNLLFLCNYERYEFYGSSLLHLATLKNQRTMVKWLLQGGVSPMSCNTKGETPLQIARKNKYYEIITILEGKPFFSSTFNRLSKESTIWKKEVKIQTRKRQLDKKSFLLVSKRSLKKEDFKG